MNNYIRIAKKKDAKHFIEIKNQLAFETTSGSNSNGGFLLGTDLATYEFYIANGFCLVAEINHKVIGFGIILGDALLRKSDLWQRKDEVNWGIDIGIYENKTIGYIEQLAFLKGNRRLALKLAYNLAKWVFDKSTDALFTTTVNKPVVNLAALPFIHALSGIKIGELDEFYPSFGPIKSDIHLIESNNFYKNTQSHPLFNYLNSDVIALS